MPETEEKKEAAPIQQEPPKRDFHEDSINGEGFSQYDPITGWVWIGLKLPKFNFRTAWAFVKSQEFMISHAFDMIEQERMRSMHLANAGKGNGKGGIPIPDWMRKLYKQ